MSYPANTILERKEPKGDFLDRIKVVGPSPIRQPSLSEWEGVSGDVIVVNPAGDEFGSAQNVPVGIVQRDYDVIEYGDEAPTELVIDTTQRRRAALETPEQAFAKSAREIAEQEGRAQPRANGKFVAKAKDITT